MQVYQGTLELLDYVFFATVERGKVYETGAFIHNYALTYALRLAQAPYAHLLQEPHYAKELAPLNEAGLYIMPASPIEVEHRLVQWNTIREGYDFPGKEASIGYPDWGFARMLRPGSHFCFYLLVADPVTLPQAPTLHNLLAGQSTRIRLGKFPGKAGVTLVRADQITEREGFFTARPLLNWQDLPIEPELCDILAAALPTKLVCNARFPNGHYYEARFGEKTVCLPAGMRFLARAETSAPLARRRRL